MKCVFWKNNKCNSQYGKNIKFCDGVNPPEECPYNFKKLFKKVNKCIKE